MKNCILSFMTIVSFSILLTSCNDEKDSSSTILSEKEKVTSTHMSSQRETELPMRKNETGYFSCGYKRRQVVTERIAQLFQEMYSSKTIRYLIFSHPSPPSGPNIMTFMMGSDARYDYMSEEGGCISFTLYKWGFSGSATIWGKWTKIIYWVDEEKMQALLDAITEECSGLSNITGYHPDEIERIEYIEGSERLSKSPNQAYAQEDLLPASPKEPHCSLSQILEKEEMIPSLPKKDLRGINRISHYSLPSLNTPIIATKTIDQLFLEMYSSRKEGWLHRFPLVDATIKPFSYDAYYARRGWKGGIYMYRTGYFHGTLEIWGELTRVMFEVDQESINVLIDAMEAEARNQKRLK